MVTVAIESRVMKMPSLSSLAGLTGLADIGLRGSVDMRPTLIRVLTDLYMQKLRHTPDEEQHYTELALRLLDSVDAATRAAVSTRLARHLTPPLRVIQYLVKDLPDVAAPLRNHPLLQPSARPAVPARQVAAPVPVVAAVVAPLAEAVAPAITERAAAPIAPAPERLAKSGALDAAIAAELDDLFLTASVEERRLILLNLHVVAPMSPGRVAIVRDHGVGQRLEAAALSRQSDEFAIQLGQALHIPREQGRRIIHDERGEPMVVAVKALGIPRDVVYRILILANPAVGHSVERVHALATLFDEMPMSAAEGMVAIWQSLRAEARSAAKHQPLFWNDERTRARTAAARQPAPLHGTIRREAS